MQRSTRFEEAAARHDKGVADLHTPRKTKRVILADDHQIVRRALAELLARAPDIDVVGEASDGSEALKLVRQLQPDVVLMDVSMLNMGGVEATSLIHKEWPDIHIIGLSMHHREDVAKAMREAGARDYVDKDGSIERLIEVIHGH